MPFTARYVVIGGKSRCMGLKFLGVLGLGDAWLPAVAFIISVAKVF